MHHKFSTLQVLDIIAEASLYSTKQGDDIASRKSSLRRVLLRTCKDLSLVPPSLFLKGIVCPNRESPFAGGSFADIYRATYEGSPVVLKRIRVFGNNHRGADASYMSKASGLTKSIFAARC